MGIVTTRYCDKCKKECKRLWNVSSYNYFVELCDECLDKFKKWVSDGHTEN